MTPAHASAGPQAIVLSVGDELLLGRTVDTNKAWLSGFLSQNGFVVVGGRTLPDETEVIRKAVAEVVSDTDLVLVTGGLGPTEDDVTAEAVSALFSGESAELTNPLGTASGQIYEELGCVVVLLPGVPREMRRMATDGLAEFITERWGHELPAIEHRMIHTTGIRESVLARRIETESPLPRGPVTLAYLPDLRGVDLRLTSRGLVKSDADAALAMAAQTLEPVVGPFTFEARTGDLAEAVSTRLRARGLTLACAESCTGGLVSKRMTDLAGASDVFAGGVVAYQNDLKINLLGVERETLDQFGAVSEQVAIEMANGVVRRLRSEVGVSLTGVAGPGGGSEEKPVGRVWIGVATATGAWAARYDFGGDRDAIRERAAQAALFAVFGQLAAPSELATRRTAS